MITASANTMAHDQSSAGQDPPVADRHLDQVVRRHRRRGGGRQAHRQQERPPDSPVCCPSIIWNKG